MPAKVIDGKALAKSVRVALKDRSAIVTEKLGRSPKLAVVLVGEDPASQVYVASKSKMAKRCGIEPVDIKLPADVSDQALQSQLEELSNDETVDGILLQLPLPKGLDEYGALLKIAPDKDVDGLHPANQGLLMRGAKAHRPCTPKGCIELIKEARRDLGHSEDLSGLNAVVVGRSVLVGKPVAFMLLEENCTATVCHSRSKNLEEICADADILVAAVGRPEMLGLSSVKEGAIVIDVGINRLDDGRLVGDVNYEEACEKAAAVTPVPGGVGPMTIAMLLSNTVDAAQDKVA